ncbi:tRNA1(Val) (adenine(37)-N6)-methyltransferase [Desulfonatronovibrio hydrogenovorans]|uniref:tRNA1(Val) (adenine(37)-N6)-methyltransferase n=1 Tax=Desulfonatronovibrio hydrogenovorans TaxID=53245 RepID=UPI00068B9D19|nr:methyltransferase [Desulfonatronovibrio hydrogenovorans]
MLNSQPAHPQFLFPRGLSQPEQGFRFSTDSLLLSTFITPGNSSKVADLGCGCAVIGLGLILANPGKKIQVLGLDKSPEMIRHARINIARLGLDDCCSALEKDVSEVVKSDLYPESFDLVLLNPPYRDPGSGRMPADESRKAASFCTANELGLFFEAAGYLLKRKSRLGVVFAGEQLDMLLSSMGQKRLIPKRMIPVYGTIKKRASLVLVEAIKDGGAGLKILPPLVLYNQDNTLTDRALEFCPFLGCNSRR